MPDIRALVVDDEQLAREEFCFLLGEAGGVEIAGQAADGVVALRLAGELRPDVVWRCGPGGWTCTSARVIKSHVLCF